MITQNNNSKEYNLWQLNAFEDAPQNVISAVLASASYDLMEYIRYVESAIEFVNKEDAIEIPLEKRTPPDYLAKGEKDIANDKSNTGEIRFYLMLPSDLPEKKEERIYKELFDRGIRYVYSEKPTGNRGIDRDYEVEILDANKDLV